MKTKQIIITIAILVIGILIGKFVLGDTPSNAVNKSQTEAKKEVWTCSMHPQINMPEFGACPICGMDLIPKETGGNDVANDSFKMTKNAMALANIETLEVGVKSEDENNKKDGSNNLNLSGKIMANEKATAVQTAHFGGRIERLSYKSVGEYVKKGSLVASLYSPDLVTAQNEFIETLKIKKAQPELYIAVRNKLKNWKISENQIQQIENTKKVITNFNMYANVSGYIDEVLVQEGNHIKEGAPLFRVANLGSVWAMFDVYEQDIKNIKLGQQVTITSNAYPNEEIKARINYIDPNLNISTRTVQVRATLKNSKTKLKPGMLLTGKVAIKNKISGTAKNSISVPKTAVMWTGKRSIVYIKTGEDEAIFELREVTLGNSLGDTYQIIEGLENGDKVVVNGTFTVDAAAQLQGKRSMMNQKIKKDDAEKLKVKNVDRIVVNPKFKKQLHVVFQDYIAIKDAFVLTDAKQVSEKATQTLKNLKKVKMNLLKKAKAHEIWMPEVKKIKNSLEKLTKENDVEKQRVEFINLSNAMIIVVQHFGVEKEVYVQHCPMVNNNKGANWLSDDKAIKNPYFGDKMLQCGSVELTVK